MESDWRRTLREEIASETPDDAEQALTEQEHRLWRLVTERIEAERSQQHLVSAEALELSSVDPPDDLHARLEETAKQALRDGRFVAETPNPNLGDYVTFLRCLEGLRADQVGEEAGVDYEIVAALEANKLSFDEVNPSALAAIGKVLQANLLMLMEFLPSLMQRRGPALAAETGLFRASYDMTPEARAELLAGVADADSAEDDQEPSPYEASFRAKEQEDFRKFVAAVKAAWE